MPGIACHLFALGYAETAKYGNDRPKVRKNMTTKTVESNNGKLVIVTSDEVIISDGQTQQ